MPSNPLDIPEVLTLVGSFLPLWINKSPNLPTDTNALVHHYHHHNLNNNDHKTPLSFKPATLSRCLQVSTHWYRTLLPILCHGYWSFLMWQLPMEAIARYCYLFKVLYMAPYNFHCARMLLHGCTNLVELGIQVAATRDETTGWRLRGQQTAVLGLTEKQLLRSNPLIKRLHWSGIGDTTCPVLDPEDFGGLGNLEDLWLENWNCSGGQLQDVLRTVSRTLKSFRLGRIQYVEWSRVQDEDYQCKYNRLDSNVNKNVLRLDRLEWLRSDGEKANVDVLTELVKCSPNLGTLEVNVKEAWDFDGLAHSLRTYCPLLDTLDISSVLQSVSFKTLLHHCSTTGLRRLRVAVHSHEGNLISEILHHASTLEDLHIQRNNNRVDGFHYLRLLVECTHLKRFSLHSNFCWFHPNVLDTLAKQPWGCRENLQELHFSLEFFGTIQRPNSVHKKALVALLLEFGWEKVRFKEREDEWAFVDALRKVFELVRDQELEALRVLVLDSVAFRRV
ncbi:MAG: hypothetical protein J3R72DRAFT_435428 [Linnemannia gamsii]|nr:MAG: hypothetical protein J3R72DRAFT_435428 [Linnemannia gamsii]